MDLTYRVIFSVVILVVVTGLVGLFIGVRANHRVTWRNEQMCAARGGTWMAPATAIRHGCYRVTITPVDSVTPWIIP